MNYRLVYDVAAHADVASAAAIIGIGIGFATLVSVAVVYLRGSAIGAGIKFFSIASLIMLLVSALSVYEKHWIVEHSASEGKTEEGVVIGHWTSSERSSAGSKSYNEYEGFYINGRHFSYTRSSHGNYFTNRGDHQVKLRDGLPVKLRYLEEKSGERIYNHITRFEIID